VLVLFGTVMACLHVRFLLLFVPFFAPVLGVVLARWISAYDRRKDRFVLNAILMATTAILVIAYFPSQAALEKNVAQHSPVQAVQYLRQHSVPGRLFATYEFGDYLVWSMAPEQKVFIDGRGELYEREGVLADYLQIATLRPGALGVLHSYGVQSCLIRRNEPLETMLEALPDWQQVYADDLSVLFVRREPFEAQHADPLSASLDRKE
jgi:hypothetical protein